MLVDAPKIRKVPRCCKRSIDRLRSIYPAPRSLLPTASSDLLFLAQTPIAWNGKRTAPSAGLRLQFLRPI